MSKKNDYELWTMNPTPPKWSQRFLCYAEADKAVKSIHVYDYQKFLKLFLEEI